MEFRVFTWGIATLRETSSRKASRWVWLVAVLGLLSGCPYTTLEEHTCPPGGTSLTYENFGRGFIDGYCQSCHGSTSTNRYGAPGDFIFDSLDQVRRHKARIFVRSASSNDSMPPGPADPSRAERDRLAEWLVCGAP